MNEQLIVKNFGPIKDATVDFKRVTVFIGPTGGGKSTLAKLAAVFRNHKAQQGAIDSSTLATFSLINFWKENSQATWNRRSLVMRYATGKEFEQAKEDLQDPDLPSLHIVRQAEVRSWVGKDERRAKIKLLISLLEEDDLDDQPDNELAIKWQELFLRPSAHYIPSERIFSSAIEYSKDGFMRDNIGLPKVLLDFNNSLSIAKREAHEVEIGFLNVKYIHKDGQDFIEIPGNNSQFRLYETASGIQSVAPLLVLLEHLSHNIEQAQSFIVEEPELNLFPLAQFELVKILVDKCARTDGKNDLVLTTHSPYVLTALNLLCYAYRIAQQDEATAKKVAKLIPRHCWIDPDQFAAYYVDRPDTKRKQQVRSIINKKTGLIEENELDTASDELGAVFDKLVRLRKPTQTPSRAS